jgi:ABC-2 type transport system permease protein
MTATSLPRAPGLGSVASGVFMIAQRDLKKLIRDRSRFAVNLAFPIVLIVGLGGALQSSVGRVTGLDSMTLTFTGVLAAMLFQSTAAGMISIVEDRENDFSRELFVSPAPRLVLVGGKVVGELCVAVLQGACVVLLSRLVGADVSMAQLGRIALPCLGCGLLGAAFGLVTVAALPNQRSAMQVFQFLIIPQYVVGGVVVPLHDLPRYLDVVVRLMPMRYAVGLVREAFYATSSRYSEVSVDGIAVDAVVVFVLTAVLMTAGTAVFVWRERNR